MALQRPQLGLPGMFDPGPYARIPQRPNMQNPFSQLVRSFGNEMGERDSGPPMEDDEENRLRKQLMLFGKSYDWNDEKTSKFLANYLAQPNVESKRDVWQKEIGGRPNWLQKVMKQLIDLKERTGSITPSGFFGAPFTPENIQKLSGGLSGGPPGMLPIERYQDPLGRMAEEYPGQAMGFPGPFRAGVEDYLKNIGPSEPWSKERIARGELQEIPDKWKSVAVAAKKASPARFYNKQALEQARQEFPTQRERIVFDSLLDEMELPSSFADLNADFLSGIGVNADTKNTITPTMEEIDDNEARFARKLLLLNPNPPTSQQDQTKVAAFFYGLGALRPDARAMMEAIIASVKIPEDYSSYDLEELRGTSSRSPLQEALYREPALYLPMNEQLDRAIALRGTGLYDERTLAHIIRLIGSPETRAKAYDEFKLKEIVQGEPSSSGDEAIRKYLAPTAGEQVQPSQPVPAKPQGDIIDAITQLITTNPDINGPELVSKLKAMGYTDADIDSVR